jgi:hypothetical protein
MVSLELWTGVVKPLGITVKKAVKKSKHRNRCWASVAPSMVSLELWTGVVKPLGITVKKYSTSHGQS